MQYMDIFELEVAGDVQISPDGSRIAYVRRSMDVMKDSTRGSIWLIDSTGETIALCLLILRATQAPDGHQTVRGSPISQPLAFTGPSSM